MKVPRRHVELYDTIMGCLGYTSPDGGINENNNWCRWKSKARGLFSDSRVCSPFLSRDS